MAACAAMTGFLKVDLYEEEPAFFVTTQKKFRPSLDSGLAMPTYVNVINIYI